MRTVFTFGTSSFCHTAESRVAVLLTVLAVGYVGTRASASSLADVEQVRIRAATIEEPYAVHSWSPQGTLASANKLSASTASPASMLLAMSSGTPPVTYEKFEGLVNSAANPPDPNTAAGPKDIVQMVNAEWAAYSKTGTLLFKSTLQQWYGFSQMHMFDPRIEYDATSGHYIMTNLRYDSSGNGYLDLSISTTSSAQGSWCKYDISVQDSNNQPDFPGLGYDSQAVYYSMNMYSVSSGKFYGADLLILDKAQLYQCTSPVSTYTFHALLNPSGSKAYAIQPAQTLDNEPAEYLADSLVSGGNNLTVWTLTSPLSNPQISAAKLVVSRAYSVPPNAPQLGTSNHIVTGGTSLLQAVVRSGVLWTAHTVGYGANSAYAAAQWYALDPVHDTVVQEQAYSVPGAFVYYPAITVNPAGNAFMIYDLSSPTAYVSVHYTGRLATDPAGQMDGDALLHAGHAPCCSSSTLQKWGDFFSAAVDPNDTTKAWICGEYANTTTQYGTAIGEVGF